ncbi:DUF423 domain-containing protein [Alicyclobacillus sp. SO9]|uniref:DUF423 domain-containing protein n=1 Tax=Alicyclobacillus sp. SO9 TaxID=2665646 RepID=UPI0018E73C0E|nr:DUF423 domain-containing protein [Alicyclobacillus sp. SO9]QQE78147.1 DUF423 domain-containing protein [Alicyclobacillus sp. SO9]
MTYFVLGSVAGFLAVALGAFGAHALRDKIPEDRLAVYQTGVQYQMYHAFALVVVGILMRMGHSAALSWAGMLFTAGIVLFSGSLYTLAGTGIRKLGAITPIGGLCFLGGWIALLIGGGSVL